MVMYVCTWEALAGGCRLRVESHAETGAVRV